jgi:hypothetical protein
MTDTTKRTNLRLSSREYSKLADWVRANAKRLADLDAPAIAALASKELALTATVHHLVTVRNEWEIDIELRNVYKQSKPKPAGNPIAPIVTDVDLIDAMRRLHSEVRLMRDESAAIASALVKLADEFGLSGCISGDVLVAAHRHGPVTKA